MPKNLTGDEILAGDVVYVAGASTAGMIYLAFPSVSVPRFLIPQDDAAAQKFVLRLLSADKGVIGMVMRILVCIPGGVRFLRPMIFRERITV